MILLSSKSFLNSFMVLNHTLNRARVFPVLSSH